MDETNSLIDDKDKHINFENRLEVPFIEKKLGDIELKNENWDEAMKHYSKVGLSMKILAEEKALSEEQLKKYIHEVSIPTYLNMSLASMKLKKWESVIRYCDKVIEILFNNPKALYRKSIALFNLGKTEDGKFIYDCLKEIIPNAPELIQLEKFYQDHLIKNKLQTEKFYSNLNKKFVQPPKKTIFNIIKSLVKQGLNKICCCFNKNKRRF